MVAPERNDVAQPATGPANGSASLVCACGQTLARVEGGVWVFKYAKRRYRVRGLLDVQCDNCRAVVQVEPPPEAVSPEGG